MPAWLEKFLHVLILGAFVIFIIGFGYLILVKVSGR